MACNDPKTAKKGTLKFEAEFSAEVGRMGDEVGESTK